MEGIWADFFADGAQAHVCPDVLSEHLHRQLVALSHQITTALQQAFGPDSASLQEFQALPLTSGAKGSFLDVQLFLDACVTALLPARSSAPPRGQPGHPSILIVDDSEDMQWLCRRALDHAQLHVHAVGTAEAALHYVQTTVVDLVILDFMLPPPILQLQGRPRRERVMNGVGLMHELLRVSPGLTVVFISAEGPEKLRDGGVPNDVPIVQKPFRSEVFQATVQQLLDGRSSGPTIAPTRASTPTLQSRKHERLLVRCRVTVQEERATAEGQVEDLSEGGCKIRVTVPPPVGTHVTLRIHLPSTEPLKINVAVVRWTAARAVGVEFLWIDPPVLSGLQRYLRQCGNPTSPLRADRRKE